VTTVKQLCLGVAVAGVVAGAGSALATGVAYAETTTSDTTTSDSTTSDSKSSNTKSAETQSSDTKSETGPARSTRAADEPATPQDDSADYSAASSAKNEDKNNNDGDGDTAAPSTSAKPTEARRFGSRRGQGVDQQPNTDTTAVTTAPEPQTQASLTPVRSPQQPALPAPFVPVPTSTTTAVSANQGNTSRNRAATADAAAQITDPTTQHVLVIGVDGTNLTRVLDNPGNANFFDLMDTGVTGPSTIVGHTTISNPSWTAILTGVWDTKSGVINNVFTPQTYNNWPTLFNQLESHDPNINTKAIADWQVITDIAGAGSHPADETVFIPRGADDPVYAGADAAVTDETVKSILGTTAGYEDVPNFLFTYMTQVDEAGHQYGGASPEYAAAIARTNTNVGAILDAVAARETASCAAGACEDWTVIMVTDHGHQPQQGFGHGFQSPDETATFVIVDGPDFADGQMNLKYSIVDITPTVVSLFGGTPTVDADGVPLTDLEESQVDPVDLHQAINDVFDRYGWPDIATNVALSLRTVFATIPYYIDDFTADITSQLQAVAGQGIFLVSDLAAIAVFPVEVIGDALYAVTNAIAQVVARLTGAGVIPPSTSGVERDGQPYLYPVWV
jgi:hypothetical protein